MLKKGAGAVLNADKMQKVEKLEDDSWGRWGWKCGDMDEMAKPGPWQWWEKWRPWWAKPVECAEGEEYEVEEVLADSGDHLEARA